MKAIILAAGRGTRLAPLTDKVPKTLIKICDKPILEWVFESLPSIIDEVVIVHNYLGEKIIDFCKDKNFTPKIHFIREEILGGTYHALFTARNFIVGDEKFLVIHGDDIHRKSDLEAIVKMDRAYGIERRDNITEVAIVDNVANVVDLTNVEMYPNNVRYITTGAYVLTSEVFYMNPVEFKSGETGLPHTLVSNHDSYPILAYEEIGFLQVNTVVERNLAEEKLSGIL